MVDGSSDPNINMTDDLYFIKLVLFWQLVDSSKLISNIVLISLRRHLRNESLSFFEVACIRIIIKLY